MTSITDINSTLQNMVRLIGQIALDLKNVLASIATGTAPGGSNQQVQYNNSGAFGGIAGSVWDGKNFFLTAGAGSGGGAIVFVGGASSSGLPSGAVDMVGGNSSGTGPGGSAGIGAGAGNPTAVGGTATVKGGPSSGAGGGPVVITGGSDSAAGNGGDIYIGAGKSNTGTSGNIYLGPKSPSTSEVPLPTSDPGLTNALWNSGDLVVLSGFTPGISATIVTAKLTGGGANGSMTFTNGILTAQTPAT